MVPLAAALRSTTWVSVATAAAGAGVWAGWGVTAARVSGLLRRCLPGRRLGRRRVGSFGGDRLGGRQGGCIVLAAAQEEHRRSGSHNDYDHDCRNNDGQLALFRLPGCSAAGPLRRRGSAAVGRRAAPGAGQAAVPGPGARAAPAGPAAGPGQRVPRASYPGTACRRPSRISAYHTWRAYGISDTLSSGKHLFRIYTTNRILYPACKVNGKILYLWPHCIKPPPGGQKKRRGAFHALRRSFVYSGSLPYSSIRSCRRRPGGS